METYYLFLRRPAELVIRRFCRCITKPDRAGWEPAPQRQAHESERHAVRVQEFCDALIGASRRVQAAHRADHTLHPASGLLSRVKLVSQMKNATASHAGIRGICFQRPRFPRPHTPIVHHTMASRSASQNRRGTGTVHREISHFRFSRAKGYAESGYHTVASS
jgi:hypothetical protein